MENISSLQFQHEVLTNLFLPQDLSFVFEQIGISAKLGKRSSKTLLSDDGKLYGNLHLGEFLDFN